MKKNSELIWEFSLAWVAFAGGATLLAGFFPLVPTYIFGILFVIGFIFMLISFGMRIHENMNPVVVDWALLIIDTMAISPSLSLTVGFIAKEKTNISNHIFIEFPKDLDFKIRQIAKIESYCTLKEPWNNYVPIEAGQYLEINLDIPFKLLPSYDKNALNDINFKNPKLKLRWSVIGQHNKRVKLDIVQI